MYFYMIIQSSIDSDILNKAKHPDNQLITLNTSLCPEWIFRLLLIFLVLCKDFNLTKLTA